VNILGVSQAHVPTIFIPYAGTLGLFLLTHLFTKSQAKLQKVLIAGLILIAANAFWVLPYGYSAIHKSAEISAAKQNRW
jgi:ABC-type transport system involved in multi-copper enzyme maturation permease subunit